MEANDFLVKIKANGNSKDWDDLVAIYNEYKTVISKLSPKDRGSFSLNVLCLLCRNIDKVPSWKEAIDCKELLTLSIDCLRETRGLNKPEQIKTLACIYHLNKYVVRKNAPVPPELILKVSYMAFEAEPKNLLKDYHMTYWNILTERLTFIEKLKGKAINKLIPKLTEDILKVVEIFNIVTFCNNIIVFLFKKLHAIFSEQFSEQLNVLYGDIFKKISSKDLNEFKTLDDRKVLDLYMKISDCLYVTAENASKNHFKDSSFSIGVRTAISLFGHRPDMFHCLQTFYLNAFCDLFENKITYVDTLFKNLTVSCDVTEKLGYKDTMIPTYAFLNQFLRLYIEYSVTNSIETNFTLEIQENCLNFMLKLLSVLKFSHQILKCENCSLKSGLHDALRLSFLLKHFITNSLQYNIDITSLTTLYIKVINTQYEIMNELTHLKCSNAKKFNLKLQTDTHNTAIMLNKHKKYEFSIKLFEIYIKNELHLDKSEKSKAIEAKNVARAFYNKSICEQDCKMYDNALLDAFLSLIFSQDVNSEKNMSLIMDIKAKYLKEERNNDVDEDNDDLQMISVLEASRMVAERQLYGNLMPYLKDVKFSSLLKHEYTMYAKLWPSIVPIAGVWKSLLELLEGNAEKWITVENEDTILWTLLEVVSLTPSAVRTINSEYFKDVVFKLLQRIDRIPDPVPSDIKVAQTTLLFLKAEYDIMDATLKYKWKITETDPVPSDIKVAQTTLLFLKAEYDIMDATLKYKWKITETNTDPDLIKYNRTIEQEHEALQNAIQAVKFWTELAAEINTVTKSTCLRQALVLADIFVPQLLHYSRIAHGLQLAHVCCVVAKCTEHKEIFIRNTGVLAYHIATPNILQENISTATQYWGQLLDEENCIETVLIFLCDIAIYNFNCGCVDMAARLIQLAQVRILKAYENNPDINLDLAVGRLLEVQVMMCKDSGPSLMSAVNGLQRHYLSVGNNALSWSSRRLRSYTIRYQSSTCSTRCALSCSSLSLPRRARASLACACAVLNACVSARAARWAVNTHNMQQAQVTINGRLKYILGLPVELTTSIKEAKVPLFTPKQDLEVMLESQPFRSLSPTREPFIPGYKIPEFLKHNNCDCFACDNVYCTIISYIIGGLEASVYFRANETEIAQNYFHGVINSFAHFDRKLKFVLNKYSEVDFEKYIVEHVRNVFENEFKVIKLEILIEACYFELRNKNFDKADDYIVTVHEILEDFAQADGYIKNEVMNLMVASAKVRNMAKKLAENLENDFDDLKISPKGEAPKTPESTPKVLIQSSKKIVVKDEELPKKRKVIKLNLDEGSSDEKDQEKPKSKKPEFKIPVPVLSKPVIEALTPRPTRTPKITITDTNKTSKTKTTITDTNKTSKTKTTKKQETNLENDFANLKLSPKKDIKPKLSENEELTKKTRIRKGDFKIPGPSKPETTPRHTDNKKSIFTDIATPKTETKSEFFTPQSTPEQFFTPLNTIKTYSKSNLRKNIVKNLEEEFSTPLGKELKEKEGGRSGRNGDKTRALRRAVSPGKLVDSQTRPRRLRQPKLD